MVAQMNDPMNQLPIDADWIRKVDAVTEQAARDLGCMVIVVAMQDGGKLGITIDGVPESGPLHDIAQDMPRLLASLSLAASMQDAHDLMKGAQH